VVERFSPVSDDVFLQLTDRVRAPEGVRTCYDLIPGEGPLSGIHGALSHARHPRVFITACDMPGADPRLPGILASREGYEAVVPVWRNGWIEPLCALYLRSLIPMAERMLSEGSHRLAHLLDPPVKVALVPIEPMVEAGLLEGDCFVNINTRDDLRRWVATNGERSVSPEKPF
jgi:molybdopterin-guanine dinucleotide biosynthesis protein A